MAHQPHTEILHHSTPTATLSHYVRLDRYLFQQPLHVKVLQADFPWCSSCTSTKSDRWRHNAHLSMCWEVCRTAASSNAAVSASVTLRPQRITQARRKRARHTTTSTPVTWLCLEGSAIIEHTDVRFPLLHRVMHGRQIRSKGGQQNLCSTSHVQVVGSVTATAVDLFLA